MTFSWLRLNSELALLSDISRQIQSLIQTIVDLIDRPESRADSLGYFAGCHGKRLHE